MNSHWWRVFQDAKASLNDTESGSVATPSPENCGGIAHENDEAIFATQFRLEELLLELITERVLACAPTKPDQLDESPSTYYNGFHDGWWECLEQLRTVIDNHEEGNEYRLARRKR